MLSCVEHFFASSQDGGTGTDSGQSNVADRKGSQQQQNGETVPASPITGAGAGTSTGAEGYTLAYVLAESLAAIHTYPEHNACFVDLFTCGRHCDARKFDQVMQSHPRPQSIVGQHLVRS